MLGAVRDGEDFGGVRKELEFYSNELCSHLKVQDVATKRKGEALARVQTSLGKLSMSYAVSQSQALPTCGCGYGNRTENSNSCIQLITQTENHGARYAGKMS
jgi:hypothetical protein